MDLRKDGKIYWTQFLAFTISAQIYLKYDNLIEAFAYFDSEKRGYFDINNLKT